MLIQNCRPSPTCMNTPSGGRRIAIRIRRTSTLASAAGHSPPRRQPPGRERVPPGRPARGATAAGARAEGKVWRNRGAWRSGEDGGRGRDGGLMPRRLESLSPAEARRLALAAQGFGRPRPSGPVDAGHVSRLLDRLGLVQIDSVSAVVRAHYMPLFSRLGPYSRELLDRLAYARRGRALFEYWGHEASLIPLRHHRLLRWRMERAARGEGIYGGLARFATERAAFVEEVLAEVRDRGAVSAAELACGGRGQGSWWGWSDGKKALEFLFWAGRVTTATRRGTFERVYDLPERVLPAAVLAEPAPDPAEARRALLRLAARATGVASERCLRDYFRLDVADARARLAELVEAGELRPVQVLGWAQPAYVPPESVVPRRIKAAALLAPFDALVWERERAERLFGFRYRLEIYTPAAQRRHGYYVLPFLLGDRLAARVDLRSDRAGGTLWVLAAHAEPDAGHAATASALAAELRRLARWLGLGRGVAVAARGDLSPALRREAGSVDGVMLEARDPDPLVEEGLS